MCSVCTCLSWGDWINWMKQAVWWSSLIVVDLQEMQNDLKAAPCRRTSESYCTKAWDYQTLPFPGSRRYFARSHFPPMGNNLSCEVLEWKMALCRKSWRTVRLVGCTRCEHTHVCVWGRENEIGTGGAGHWGWFCNIIQPCRMVEKASTQPEYTQTQEERVFSVVMKAFFTLRSSQACCLCV